MSSQTVAQSASSVRALSNTTHTLNRLILENDPKVGRIDEFAHTNFRAQWTGNREVRLPLTYGLAFVLSSLCAEIPPYHRAVRGRCNQAFCHYQV